MTRFGSNLFHLVGHSAFHCEKPWLGKYCPSVSGMKPIDFSGKFKVSIADQQVRSEAQRSAPVTAAPGTSNPAHESRDKTCSESERSPPSVGAGKAQTVYWATCPLHSTNPTFFSLWEQSPVSVGSPPGQQGIRVTTSRGKTSTGTFCGLAQPRCNDSTRVPPFGDAAQIPDIGELPRCQPYPCGRLPFS